MSDSVKRVGGGGDGGGRAAGGARGGRRGGGGRGDGGFGGRGRGFWPFPRPDTSVNPEMVCSRISNVNGDFTADLVRGEELGPARRVAENAGCQTGTYFHRDLREEFSRIFVFPMMRASAI